MTKWSGLFSKNISDRMHHFNSSISFDYRLAKYDVEGTIAHVKMLNKIGIFSGVEMEKTILACNNLLEKIKSNTLVFDWNAEDIHFFVPLNQLYFHSKQSPN